MKKEAVVAWFEVVSEHWPGENEEKHEETSRPNVSFVVFSDSHDVMTLTDEAADWKSRAGYYSEEMTPVHVYLHVIYCPCFYWVIIKGRTFASSLVILPPARATVGLNAPPNGSTHPASLYSSSCCPGPAGATSIASSAAMNLLIATKHVRQFYSSRNNVVDFPPRSWMFLNLTWHSNKRCDACVRGKGLPNSNTGWKTVNPILFRKNLKADWSQGMLAIVRCRIFCLPVCCPKI